MGGLRDDSTLTCSQATPLLGLDLSGWRVDDHRSHKLTMTVVVLTRTKTPDLLIEGKYQRGSLVVAALSGSPTIQNGFRHRRKAYSRGQVSASISNMRIYLSVP